MKNRPVLRNSFSHLRSILALSLLFLAARADAATDTVTSPADSGAGTLRAVIAGASAGDTVIFDSSLAGQTILLTSGQIVLGNDVTIDGSALSSPVQLNGNQQSRVFSINGGVTVVLNSLFLTNGYDTSSTGGAIYNQGTLTVNQSAFSGNVTVGYGGAVFTYGSVVFNSCTFVGNSAGGGGGAFWNGAESAMNNCTFVNNMAGVSGGGFQNQSQLTVVNCTFTGNSAANNGGGIYNLASVYLTNSIVCGNTAGNVGPNINGSTYTGVNLVDTDPQLAPLGSYGGPTQTMPPLPGSPAIDAGVDSDATGLASDQRGFPRIAGAHVDLGAVEGVTTSAGPFTLTGTTRLGDGSLRFAFTNYSDLPFNVLAGTNIASPLSLWTNLGPVLETLTGSGQYQFTDPQAANYPQRFYRVTTP